VQLKRFMLRRVGNKVEIVIDDDVERSTGERVMGKKKLDLDVNALSAGMDTGEDKPKGETPMENQSGFVVPNIPMPADVEEREVVHDECDVAFKFAFIGAGQAGARMVETFYKLGYRRVCAINTNSQDLTAINIPEENKLVMDIGEGGAGKEPEKGKQAVKQYYEDVYDLMKRSFGKDWERILICIGAGGGTGSGSVETLVDISHDIAESFKLEGGPGQPPVVGVLVSMPQSGEGQKVNYNAHNVLTMLFGKVGRDKGKIAGRSISPLIIVDNDRISKLYPGLPVTQFWGVANQSISGLFHLFNNIAATRGENAITTFDRSDLAGVLTSGVITFGATPLIKWDSATDISYAIRDNLRRNILVAELDLNIASIAACVVIGKSKVLDVIPQENLEHGYEMLSRVMKSNSVVHRGLYKLDKELDSAENQPDLVVYTVLGELGVPESRMDEIARIGGKGTPRR